MKKLVIGNWKMDPSDSKSALKIVKGVVKGLSKIKNIDVVVCPPFLFLPELVKKTRSKKLQFGAQDIAAFPEGSHTGEISGVQLKTVGTSHAIIGHSERRALGETNELIAQKVETSLQNKLHVVLCIGERRRDESNGKHLEFLKTELLESLVHVDEKELKNITIAYEPIWAIGAEEAMHPEQIHEMSIFIKKVLSEKFGPESGMKTRIIYGGSVNSANIEEIMRDGHIDGVLPGRASRDPKEFNEIVRVVAEK